MVTAPLGARNRYTQQPSGRDTPLTRQSPTMHTRIVTAQRISSHDVQGPHCAKDPSTHSQPSGGTGSQVGHLVGHMPPEMQPLASAWVQEMITITLFVLVEERKRRDSNPRMVAHRSLSRWATC